MRYMARIITPRIQLAVALFMPLIAFALSIVAVYFALVERGDSQIIIDSSQLNDAQYQAVLEESEQNFRRAQDAISAAELVLSFLEGASVLAGIILVGAGILGLTSIQDLRHDTEDMKQEVINRLEKAETELTERVERAEKELLSRAEQLAELESQLEQTIGASQQRIDEQIQSANKEAQRTFEALSHHVMAQRLARENNIDAAIKTCRDAHDLDPDNVSNNYLLGTLLIRKDELDEAIEHLTEAFEDARQDSETASTPAQAALGLALRKKGDHTEDVMERNRLYNQAESYLLEATQSDPYLLNENKESYLGVLGSLYRRQGRTRDAVVVYEQATDITPRRSYPEINLAMLYLGEGDEAHAERHRKRAEAKADRRLQDTPEDYWARYDLALALLMRGEVEQGLEHFQEAVDITPDVMTVASVMSRLEYLQTVRTEMEGISEAIERLKKLGERFLAAA